WSLLFLPSLARPDQVERAVGRDTVKPGAEARSPIEAGDLPVNPQKGFLHQVFSVLFVSRHAKRQTEHTMAMPLHQHTEGVSISGADLCDCRGIALFHPAAL